MSNKKIRNILFGLLGLGVLVFIAVSFIGTSMLSKKSRAMVDLKIQSASIDAQLTNLAQAKKDVEKYRSFNDIAATVIPKDKNQVHAIADIFQIAEESGISLQTISFPASSLGTKSTSGTAGATAGVTQQPTTSSTPTQTVISQAKPFPSVPGLFSLELDITPQSGDDVPDNKKVAFAKFIDFLSAIENNRRTAQITQVTIQPSTAGDGSDRINFGLKLNIFIKP